MKAWLVTWEWCGEHAKRDDKIAGIFNPRFGGVRVRELVEIRYANEYTLSERMDLARGRPNPYPAKFGTLDCTSAVPRSFRRASAAGSPVNSISFSLSASNNFRPYSTSLSRTALSFMFKGLQQSYTAEKAPSRQ